MNKIIKEIKLGKKIKLLEKIELILKYITVNLGKNLSISEQKLFKVRFLLSKKIKKHNISKTRLVRRCLLTGRSRSSIRLFNVSRIKLREIIKKKIVNNIVKRCF